ncbi:hypothetical protein T11_6244 [Trichinella zimbabwensis]|uniref:Uncharacterized protein n=1 Tax=Trichinella zimbabwensis TaxID=268475 RepID=A0A0V1I1U2_9BILA|nr:hypothetical protein T11_6244 [Trichinella zimbabwensis]
MLCLSSTKFSTRESESKTNCPVPELDVLVSRVKRARSQPASSSRFLSGFRDRLLAIKNGKPPNLHGGDRSVNLTDSYMWRVKVEEYRWEHYRLPLPFSVFHRQVSSYRFKTRSTMSLQSAECGYGSRG